MTGDTENERKGGGYMVFRDSTYKVLIVSSSDQFNDSTKALLPPSVYWPVKCVKTAGEARRLLIGMNYDLILINAPLQDEFGSRLATDLCTECSAGVLLFVKNELYDDIYAKVMEAGVMVIGKPTSGMMVAQTLRMMCSARERMRQMEQKQTSVEDKINEIRVMNRAKWLLIENEGMTEDEAHHYIEKQAMDQRLSKAETAERIIAKYGET